MEIPQDKSSRIGQLPKELRDMLQAYRLSPEIALHCGAFLPDETPYYIITIKYPDGSSSSVRLEFNEEIMREILCQTTKYKESNFLDLKLGHIEYESDNFGVYLDNDGAIEQRRGCALHITLSKNSLIILIEKLREFSHDFLQYIKDPEKNKIKQKY